MACYWPFCPPLHDVAAVSIEADVESVLIYSYILFATIPAFNQVYHIVGLGSGCGLDPEGLSGGYGPDGDALLDVFASETELGVTTAGSTDEPPCGTSC